VKKKLIEQDLKKIIHLLDYIKNKYRKGEKMRIINKEEIAKNINKGICDIKCDLYRCVSHISRRPKRVLVFIKERNKEVRGVVTDKSIDEIFKSNDKDLKNKDEILGFAIQILNKFYVI
jgi:hypothetical protein